MKESANAFNTDVEQTRSRGIGEIVQHGDPDTSTKRGLKSRHAQMIALGGTIGTGKF